MARIDRHLWHRFWVIAAPYWRTEERWKARGLLALLVVLLLAQTRFAVLLNDQTGEFTSALAAKDGRRFWHAIKLCLGLLLVAAPIYAFFYYVRDKLGIYWRKWLTGHFLGAYFGNRRFYELNANAGIDNPDQRIAEDVNTFTQRSLYFLLILIGALLQLVAFSSVLWTVSREMVYFLVVYATLGTLVTWFVFGKVLIGLNFLQIKREADFRFGLIRIRENAESIAFYRGEVQEARQVKRRFTEAFKNFNKLIKRQLFLNLFQYTYGFATVILPSMIIASRVLSGELEVGRAVQAAGAFAAVLTAISLIVDNFESLSRFAAGVDRLSTFSTVLAGPAHGALAGSVIESVRDARLSLDHVTVQTPGRERTLVTDLSLAIHPGQGLMIVGASGSGKSSLQRAIAGLWYAGSGTISKPDAADLLFLPQQPYMILGSLRSQLLYPKKDSSVPDAELLELLEKVNLGGIAERFGGLDAERDWVKVLSVGEQQRIAFARVLLSKPTYVMLDEATSALDLANEESLYRVLAETSTTMVSVSHRPTILKYHKHVLVLADNGAWNIQPANGYQFSE